MNTLTNSNKNPLNEYLNIHFLSSWVITKDPLSIARSIKLSLRDSSLHSEWQSKKDFLLYFLKSLEKLKNNERIVIWLSWWNSLKIFYGELKDNFWDIDENLRNKIYFCFLDERVVDFESDYSNYKLCKNLFLDSFVEKWLIKKEQILLPDFSLEDYEINYFLKVKKIDIWLFWVGEDGHTCSLFPNHKLLLDNTYWYLKISDSPKPPKDRITISKSMLEDIKYAFVFFIWESKQVALNNFLDENMSYKNCPAKLILNCENVSLVIKPY
jgi:6-phosphogluconolactonase